MTNEPKRAILVSNTGKGKELQELLRKELGIPERVQWFEVRFAIEEPVRVVCQFHPVEER